MSANRRVTSEAQPPATPRASVSDAIRTWIWWIIALLITVTGFVLVAATAPPANQGIPDQASALVLITGAAVAIERLLEIFWTAIDATKGSFWPIRLVDEVVAQITAEVSGPVSKLAMAVDDAVAAGNLVDSRAADAQRQITYLQNDIAKLNTLAPSSPRAQLIVSSVAPRLTALQESYPELKTDIDTGDKAIKSIDAFVESIKDNPGRRIISIFLGTLIGLGVVWFLGLDVFAATLGTGALAHVTIGPASQPFLSWQWRFGCALTGAVIGLGSSPTHEVIKALQLFKQKQK
jgi:hypothetical protein